MTSSSSESSSERGRSLSPPAEVIMGGVVHVTSIADVCLVLSSGNRIFANVAVLRNASTVFRAMLGPHFLEGQAIIANPESTQEVNLPEDDPLAMLAIMRVVHHQYQLVSEPEPKTLREIAILADKYDVCHVILPVFMDLYTTEVDTNGFAEKLWYQVTAAYIVGHREAFTDLSWRLLLDCCVPSIRLIGDYKTFRPSDLAMATLLEEKRAKVRALASTTILNKSEIIVQETPDKSIEDPLLDSVRVYYEDCIEITINNLHTIMPDSRRDLRREFGGATVVEQLVSEIENEAEAGLCFDCVGTYGSHCREESPE